MKTLIRYGMMFLLAMLCFACQGRKHPRTTPSLPSFERADVPTFSKDSAYCRIQEQLAFGPRVPGSRAHRLCGDYLVEKMKQYGAQVYEQQAQVTAYDGKLLPMRNIIASVYPEKTRRVLLCAHWDSRPWCDQDQPNRQQQAVPGANDGASGVAVLMEIARCLQTASTAPNIGIDIVFFDVEDYGAPQWERGNDHAWCLGSQYWSQHPHRTGYQADYGILLDMVGASDACFLWEYFSKHYAFDVLQKVWNQASALGYGRFFQATQGGAVTDDHLFVNRLAGIPCIDIIDYDDQRGGFFEHWHTAKDDIDIIDPTTLEAVGRTLLATLYAE